jgi:DNA-binding SARP family transcriptional activator
VLGLLVLHHGTWLHRDAIIAALWGDTPPPSAVAEVLGYVNRLRDLLDPMRADRDRAGLIASAGRAYQFCAERAAVDLTVAGRLGRRAAESAGHDPVRACDLYDQALALWRHDPLADVDLLWQHPAVVALIRQRTGLVLGFATAAVAAGAPFRALRPLHELCAREPLHEQAHAQLMLALAAGGEQAAALAVFAGLRHRLDTELGVRPSPVLAGAHLAVLRQQLSPPPAPAAG